MSQWNLSVRLSGQGSDLVRTLRQSSRAARELSRDVADARSEITQLRAAARRPIRLKLSVDARRLRNQIRDAVRDADNGQGITVPLTVDADGLRTQVRLALDGAESGRITVPVVVEDPMELRRQVVAAVRWAAWGHRITIRTDVDVAGALAQLALLQAALTGLNTTINTTGGSASSMGGSWQTMAAIAVAGLAAITVAAPIAAAAITTALPLAFAGIGAAALKSDAEVKAAFASMKTSISSSLRDAAAPLQPYLIEGMRQLAAAVESVPLKEVFGSVGPLIQPLVRGITDLGGNALPGINAALSRSGPMMNAFAGALGDIGAGIGEMFDRITSGNAGNLAQIWTNLGDGIREVLAALGDMMGGLAGNDAAVESIKVAFELLADAIRFVGEAAEFVAPVVLGLLTVFDGIAQAATFVTDKMGMLTNALTFGLLDTGLDGAAGQMDNAGLSAEAAGQAVGWMAKSFGELTGPTGEATTLTAALGSAATSTSAKLDAQKASADQLKAAIYALNDANRSAYDSEIAFEAAIDDLTASFRENGATLDINTEAGRKNGSAMSAAAKAHDEMVTAGIAAGESLESMTGKSDTLRAKMEGLARSTGMSSAAAKEYVTNLLGTPGKIKTLVKLERQDAIAGLHSVQDAIAKTPGAKKVTVSTLNAAAIAALEAVGLKTRQLPDGRTQVFTSNGQSLGSISAVFRALMSLDGKTANVYTKHHYINIVENRTGLNTGKGGRGANAQANGSVLDFYADGGIQRGGVRQFAAGAENHVAQMAPAGSWRVWAEPETGGEAYIPLAPSKRTRSKAIAEETVKRLGGKGIEWNADGNITDWRYDPASGSLFSSSDAGQAAHKTRKVKRRVKGKNGKYTTRVDEVEYFSISALEAKLKSSSRAAASWSKNLTTVTDRVGADVADALAAMGKDGVALTAKMAKGSTKYINEMAAALRGLAKTAKASLTDYTRQLNKATATDSAFAANLAKLAGRGYGDLAKQLAAQNDKAAQELAAAAAGDSKKASSANAAAKKANSALSSDQVQDLVSIIAAISSSKTGIHDVAAKTGLGEDVIIDVATRGKSQLSSALGSRAAKFLIDLAKAQKGMAYANGGIRTGIYGTKHGAVTFAEPSTGGEAYIPLGAGKRRNATRVLGDVASRFGIGLQDAGGGGRIVIVREQGPLVGQTHFHIGDRRNDRDLARDIDSRQSYQLRRLARGGVGAR